MRSTPSAEADEEVPALGLRLLSSIKRSPAVAAWTLVGCALVASLASRLIGRGDAVPKPSRKLEAKDDAVQTVYQPADLTFRVYPQAVDGGINQPTFTIVKIVACNSSKVYAYRKVEVAFFTPDEDRRVFYENVWITPGEANYDSGYQQGPRGTGGLQYSKVVISAERMRAGPKMLPPPGTRPCKD